MNTRNSICDTSQQAIDILLVEENRFEAQLAFRQFARSACMENLFHVTSGLHALDFIHARGAFPNRRAGSDPLVILLNMRLSGMDGLDVLRELKSDEHMQKIIVFVLVSTDYEPNIGEAYALGASGHLVKPIEFDELFRSLSLMY